MARLFILVTALSLVATPALCMTGVLTHSCECAGSVGESCDCGSGDCADGCSHESNCPDDPCQDNVITGGGAQTRVILSQVFDAIVNSVIFEPASALSLGRPEQVSTPSPKKNLPYPPSDLPLRR